MHINKISKMQYPKCKIHTLWINKNISKYSVLAQLGRTNHVGMFLTGWIQIVNEYMFVDWAEDISCKVAVWQIDKGCKLPNSRHHRCHILEQQKRLHIKVNYHRWPTVTNIISRTARDYLHYRLIRLPNFNYSNYDNNKRLTMHNVIGTESVSDKSYKYLN